MSNISFERTSDGGLLLQMKDEDEGMVSLLHFEDFEAYQEFIQQLTMLGTMTYYNVPIGHG